MNSRSWETVHETIIRARNVRNEHSTNREREHLNREDRCSGKDCRPPPHDIITVTNERTVFSLYYYFPLSSGRHRSPPTRAGADVQVVPPLAVATNMRVVGHYALLCVVIIIYDIHFMRNPSLSICSRAQIRNSCAWATWKRNNRIPNPSPFYPANDSLFVNLR